MGRSTPSLWISVSEYVERLRKVSEMLPMDEKEGVLRFLEDLESTISLCMHTGVADPLEVLFIHLIRKMNKECESR
ncbi:hypothetical protein IMZ38_05195 [Thermosphaera chiliense]|uniref:Uncharacterized protein n=1 Tax=Thermosphaera chiliense TaxID=3402707 RepID=A0A7M1UPX4_9CREN|nr:hypothetical protein [Thermosphaera aggregans]QOR94039.1 hypothetical protein IMZ38_05195 [Thermosphaera aggregans]